MWSKMASAAVKFLVVFLICTPILAEPHFYPAPTPWQTHADNSLQDSAFTAQSQQGYQFNKPSNNVALQRKVYQFVVPFQNNQGFSYEPKQVTYQQAFKQQKNPRFLQQDARYQFNEFGDQASDQQRRAFGNNGPSGLANKKKPYTSYDAPIHHTPAQETPSQLSPSQPNHNPSEYQNFLNDIASHNGVNFELQDNSQKQNVPAIKPIYEIQEQTQRPHYNIQGNGQLQGQHHERDAVYEAVEPEILKFIQDLLLKEETRINDKELKRKQSSGVALTSYGIPINHKQVVGVQLGPAVRAVSLAHFTI